MYSGDYELLRNESLFHEFKLNNSNAFLCHEMKVSINRIYQFAYYFSNVKSILKLTKRY